MIAFKDDGRLKLLIIVGTRPEIIRLSEVIKKCRRHFDTLLVHTGQNYDYNLNGVFFRDLGLADPEVYLDAVGADLGETMGNIIAASYKAMAELKPDAVLVLGDTNSCLSVIGAKRLHIPIFHMEAGNRCKDECLPEETNRRIVDIISDVNLAYSEHARRYLADCGLPKERTFVTGSPMAEVLRVNLAAIEASDIHARLGLEKGKYILLSAHREENIDTESNFRALFTAINRMAEKYDMPVLYSCHPAQPQAPGGLGLPTRPPRHPARAARLPRLQLPADERLLRGERLRHPARGVQLLHLHRQALPGGVHPHQHRAPRGARKGLLHPLRHRRAGPAAGGRARGGPGCRGRRRRPCPTTPTRP